MRTIALTVGMAVLPDLVQLVSIVAWALFSPGGFEAVRAYVHAVPGFEPVLPLTVTRLAHHLHCLRHSAIVAGAAALLVWGVLRSFWIPLLGWWSHIMIDVLVGAASTQAASAMRLANFVSFSDARPRPFAHRGNIESSACE